MGYGLRSMEAISKGDIIIKQRTSLGLLSNQLYDTDDYEVNTDDSNQDQKSNEDREDEELSKRIKEHSLQISKKIFPGSPHHQNRLYQHLIMTQKLIVLDRMNTDGQSVYSNLIKSYIKQVPREDLTQLVFWNRNVMNQIDSLNLRNQLRDTTAYYSSIFNELT